MKQKYFYLILGILVLSLSGALAYNLSFKSQLSNEYPSIYEQYYGEDPRVIVVPILGDLVAPSNNKETSLNVKTNHDIQTEGLTEIIKLESKKKGVKGFILLIDSFGGDTKSEEMMKQTIDEIEQPIISVVKARALSTGIGLSSYTDYVFISPLSDIGDIGNLGAIGFDDPRGNGEILCWVPSNKLKNVYLPQCDKSLIDPLVYQYNENRALKDAIAAENEFVSNIANARGLSFEEVSEVADGRIMTGKEAVERGLADEFGNMNDALKWFEEKEGLKLRLDFNSVS